MIFFYYAAGVLVGLGMGMPLGRLLPNNPAAKIAACLLCWVAAAMSLGIYMLTRSNAM